MTIHEDSLTLELICKCGAVLRVESDSLKYREKCKAAFLKRHLKHDE